LQALAEGIDVVDLIGEVAEIAPARINLRIPVIGELDRRLLTSFRPRRSR
jgi:hypothetical protein